MEENKQQKPYDLKGSQSLSLYRSQNQDLIRWILNFEEELRELRKGLLGIKTIDDKEVIVPELQRVNETGTEFIIDELKMAFSKITVLSNMSEKEIYDDAKYWSFYFALVCKKNHKNWGLKSYTERSALIYSITQLYFKLLLRAKGAKQLVLLNENVSREEKVIYGTPERNKEPRFYEIWKR